MFNKERTNDIPTCKCHREDSSDVTLLLMTLGGHREGVSQPGVTGDRPPCLFLGSLRSFWDTEETHSHECDWKTFKVGRCYIIKNKVPVLIYLSVWWGLVVRRTYKQILWPLCLEKLTLLLTLISSWENMWRVQCIEVCPLYFYNLHTYMYNLPYFPIFTFSDIWVFSYRERSPECPIQGSLVLVNSCSRVFNCVFIDKRILFPILINKFIIKLQHNFRLTLCSMWGLGTWSQ